MRFSYIPTVAAAHIIIVASVLCHLAEAQQQPLDARQLTLNSASGENTSESKSQSTILELATTIIRDNIPSNYEDKKKWGMQSERWDGLHIQLKGLQLKTKRRKKLVNHGDWTMYQIELLDPKEQLGVRIENVHETEDGRLELDTYFTARVHAFGRRSKWVKGVQLYSFSADANAKLTLHIRGTIGLGFNVTKLPPDVSLNAHVTAADIKLEEFDLYRVSDVGGEVAQQLGRAVRRILDDKIADTNQKLPDKLNRQIEKKKDRLRFSVHDLVSSKWSELAEFAAKQAKATAETSNTGD